jgi:MFS family permease
MNKSTQKWRAVTITALAQLSAMSLWFVASAILPQLMEHWAVETGDAAWLTMAVQIGFVIGAFTSIYFRLADRLAPRYLFAGGAFAGALTTALVAVGGVTFGQAVLLRLVTGFALAAVYPIGMKLITTWMKEDRGLGMGILTGALAIGCASPNLVRGLGGVADWRMVVLAVAALAAVGGLLVLVGGKSGPYAAPATTFRPQDVTALWRNRGVRLANLGYLGHMWESYAMWTWIPLFLLEAYRLADSGSWLGSAPESAAALAAFAVVAIGGLGSFWGGKLADRWGRARLTIVSMLASGSCALLIGFFFHQNPWLLTAIALVWGVVVVADSGQFSVVISEYSPRATVGTALTMQLSMGFILALVSIRIIPFIVQSMGWQGAFALLALGPALGSWAMWRLDRAPHATNLPTNAPATIAAATAPTIVPIAEPAIVAGSGR